MYKDGFAHHPHQSPPDRARSLGDTIQYAGLNNVPVGPRRYSDATHTTWPQRRTALPFIFISSEHMPRDQSMKKHLDGLLKNSRPQYMIIDEHGWHLIYEDSVSGRAKLHQCYESFHNKLLFNQYELAMQCFPDGTESVDQQEYHIRGVARLEDGGERQSPIKGRSEVEPRQFEGGETTQPESLNGNASKGFHASSRHEQINGYMDGAGDAPPQNDSSNAPPEKHTKLTALNAFDVSKLPLRSDRDDSTSVASGLTRSDTSRAKRNNCHVCKGEAVPVLSPLVHCSTCRRVYHRHCHKDPAILELSQSHSWSCRSCVRKGRGPKDKQQTDAVLPSSNLEVISSWLTSQSGQANIDTEEQRGRSIDIRSSLSAINEPHAPGAHDSHEPADLENPQRKSEQQAAVTTSAEAASGAKKDDVALSDADDLVERSFAAGQNKLSSNTQQPKTGKPWTRTKLPPRSEAPTDNLPEKKRPSDPLSSKMKDLRPQMSSKQATNHDKANEAVVRNSASDLRALAQERHQSATKSGAGPETQSVSEGRQVLQASLTDQITPKPLAQPNHDSAIQRRLKQPHNDITTSTSSRVEIPESPDQARQNGPEESRLHSHSGLPAKNTSVPQVPVSEGSDAGAIQAGKAVASKGPRGPSATFCETCQRKIPQGPSGKNKFCSGCKKKMVAAAEPDSKMDTGSPIAVSGVKKTPFVAQAQVARAELHNGDQHASLNSDKGIGRKAQEQGLVAKPDHATRMADAEAPVEKETQAAGGFDDDNAGPTLEKDGGLPNATSAASIIEQSTAATVPQVAKKTSANRSQTPDVVKSFAGAEADLEQEEEKASKHVAADETAASSHTPDLDKIRTLIGDSFERPKGSRLILVGMALCSTPCRRMQAKDVIEWIINNIPTYKRGEGNWQSRISAQLSQGRLVDSGGGYWREYDWQPGDDGQPNKRWYQLLPKKERMMWTWCPVLKEPLSPQRVSATRTGGTKRRRGTASRDDAASFSGAMSMGSTSVPTTPTLTRLNGEKKGGSSFSGSKHSVTYEMESRADDKMDIDDAQDARAPAPVLGKKQTKQRPSLEEDEDDMLRPNGTSSDDEPLAKRRRRDRDQMLQPKAAGRDSVQQHTPANTEMEELPDAGHAAGAAAAIAGSKHDEGTNDAPHPAEGRRKVKVVKLPWKGSRRSSAVDATSRSWPTDREDTVASLYNEWPAYRETSFDEQDKLAEIRKRPTRKQMFGKPAGESRSRLQEPTLESIIPFSNLSPVKRSRAPVDAAPKNPYPWEDPDADPSRKTYESLEEFFDFPAEAIPIVSDGSLAYRDGRRMDDGRLPRAREVFKPG